VIRALALAPPLACIQRRTWSSHRSTFAGPARGGQAAKTRRSVNVDFRRTRRSHWKGRPDTRRTEWPTPKPGPVSAKLGPCSRLPTKTERSGSTSTSSGSRSDIEADHETLRARGVEVDAEVAREGRSRHPLFDTDRDLGNATVPPKFFFRDIDGNRFLIVEAG